MHPGPVNRGVELAGRRRSTRRRPSIIAQVEAGVVVRMAVLYELLAGAPRAPPAPTPEPAPGAAARMSPPPLLRMPAPPADLLIRGAHVLDPRTGIDAPHDVLVRGGEIAELGAPGALEAPAGARPSTQAAAICSPAFFDPHVHLRGRARSTRRTMRPGTRAAAAGGFGAIIAHAEHRSADRLRIGPELRGRPGQRESPRSRSASSPPSRWRRRAGADGDGRAARRPARSGSPTTAGPSPARTCCTGHAVPEAVRRGGRPARGGPDAVGRRRHARGCGQRPARAGRHPVDLASRR